VSRPLLDLSLHVTQRLASHAAREITLLNTVLNLQAYTYTLRVELRRHYFPYLLCRCTRRPLVEHKIISN
jgi:hypothetical protein